MKVNLKIQRSVEVPAPYERVIALFEDLETTIRRFPKLRKLKKLGELAYLWEMAPIGSRVANILHEVSYAAQYSIDLKKGRLSWKPLPQHGNASIEGAFQVERRGDQLTQLTFNVSGELRDVPVPLMYRLVAPPFIQGKFTHLVDLFLGNTSAVLLEAQPSVRKKKNAA